MPSVVVAEKLAISKEGGRPVICHYWLWLHRWDFCSQCYRCPEQGKGRFRRRQVLRSLYLYYLSLPMFLSSLVLWEDLACFMWSYVSLPIFLVKNILFYSLLLFWSFTHLFHTYGAQFQITTLPFHPTLKLLFLEPISTSESRYVVSISWMTNVSLSQKH